MTLLLHLRLRSLALLSSLAALVATSPGSRAQAADAAPIAPVTPPTAAELAARLEELLGRPGGLTSDVAAERAVATSPTVRSRQARVASADSEETQALVGMLPRASVSGRYTRLSSITQPAFGPSTGGLVATTAPAGPLAPDAALIALPGSAFRFPVILDQYLVQASLLVPVSDIPLRALRSYRAATAARDAADVEVQVARRAAATNARLAYWEWVRTAMARVVADQTLAQSNVQYDATVALEKAGRASPADVLQANARVAQSKQMLARADHAVASSLERLHTLMHDAERKPTTIGENPTLPIAIPAVRPLGELYLEALKKRLEFTALDRQSRALIEQREAARAGAYPSLSAFANLATANPNSRFVPQVEEFRTTWDLGLQVSWSPNDLPTSLAGANAIDSRRVELDAKRDELVDSIQSEVREAEQSLRDAESALTHSGSGVAAAEEAYRIRVERFKTGKATQVELAESETALLRARLDRIEAQVGLRAASIRLAYALGH